MMHGVYAYTCEVISLGLLLKEFNDAIREGDGRRIHRCWKFFLPIIKACDRKNYALEAFKLLCQYHFWFTERMAFQLMWSRTINTTGKPGKNISCDLHMEHLNRNVKSAIAGLSSNVSEESVQRVGKCIKAINEILNTFDTINHVHSESDQHTRKSREKDVQKLRECKVASIIQGREHKHYTNFKSNMLASFDKNKLEKLG